MQEAATTPRLEEQKEVQVHRTGILGLEAAAYLWEGTPSSLGLTALRGEGMR